MKSVKDELDQLKGYRRNRNSLVELQAHFLNMIQQYEGYMYDHTQAKIHAYSDKLSNQIKDIDNHRNTLETAINSLEKESHREVLTKRYIEDKTAEQVADEMFYAQVRTIYRLSKQAIKQLELIL